MSSKIYMKKFNHKNNIKYKYLEENLHKCFGVCNVMIYCALNYTSLPLTLETFLNLVKQTKCIRYTAHAIFFPGGYHTGGVHLSAGYLSIFCR